ncbi:MAG: hypothetical protein NZM15_00330 [Flavobacteriales bacterium]|nr:hypothetical protein [Flavobacteriales bacterium]MDW8431131.1 hypothetical protein [Flavobacteriales bacterium]
MTGFYDSFVLCSGTDLSAKPEKVCIRLKDDTKMTRQSITTEQLLKALLHQAFEVKETATT